MSLDGDHTHNAQNSDDTCSMRSYLAALRPLILHPLRRLFVTQCALFFLMAIIYYGLILINLQLVHDQTTGSSGGRLSCGPLPEEDYLDVVISNSAEFPGLLVAAMLIDVVGRRRTISSFFFGTAACMLSLTIAKGPGHHNMAMFTIFVARACALGFNQSLWVYTAESLPTAVRTTGVGCATAFARIGGALSPVVVHSLFNRSQEMALKLCAGLSLLSAFLAYSLPVETSEQVLCDSPLPSTADGRSQVAGKSHKLAK
eukprot:gnl/TRDRNA2_/TRDRNA2_160011_c0_seq1.p1 gnl/TRDRNA2_/TRDRNA2_160011_c0~~gnl/TRDRNA2_/TRDRNA2_160011_c0_seq1.p1  ORF type:complete len:258 (-),score=31.87 gnl/TRDRNA2_/TRDRNA2_160011_c0_seq1:27-800(-)